MEFVILALLSSFLAACSASTIPFVSVSTTIGKRREKDMEENGEGIKRRRERGEEKKKAEKGTKEKEKN